MNQNNPTDELTDAALDVDQATFDVWWSHLPHDSYVRSASIAAFRRGFSVGVLTGRLIEVTRIAAAGGSAP